MWSRRGSARLLALGSVAGIGGAGYYLLHTRTHPTFEIPIRVKDAQGRTAVVAKSFPLLDAGQVESLLNGTQAQNSLTRSNTKWTWHTAQLASNQPIEDTMAQRWASRPNGAGEHIFFAVMDGHGGYWTSRLLEKVLIPSVAFELQLLASSPQTYTPQTNSGGTSWFWQRASPAKFKRFDEDPTYVSLAIQNAFARLDSEIINAPMKLLEQPNSKGLEDPMALPTLLPSLSGSCALLALVDTQTKDLYVACTGDSRAVAGHFDPKTSRWQATVLSDDQTGRSPSEIERLQSEHPEEKATVVSNGRILGGLEPSRAFGDARYKWPLAFQSKLAQYLDGSPLKDSLKLRPAPAQSKTPPYVTAHPQITHRKLVLPPRNEPATEGNEQNLQFLVLATDGLWDELSSDEVVTLVGNHLAGTRGVVSKDTFNITPSETSRQIHSKDPRSKKDRTGDWYFVDDNLGTHLLRNAFGSGPDPTKLSRLLSITAPHSRRFRDDTSITVVVWEEETKQERSKL